MTQDTGNTPKTPPSSQFSTPKKSAHFESSTPEHGSILAGVPVNVVIDFNFDVAKLSSISISRAGKEYGVGETSIDTNRLSMRRKMKPDADEGIYDVNYKACWPDGSCHDGNFQFAIVGSQLKAYQDILGKKEVTIQLSGIAFKPEYLRLTRGTKVTWVNNDSVEHYINTDAHPAHTYVPAMNSKALKKGDSYSYTFDQAGIYPYHCSAHASTMVGAIFVDNPLSN